MSWKIVLGVVLGLVILGWVFIYLSGFLFSRTIQHVFKSNPKKELFFWDVDLKPGNKYALVVDHPDKGFFIVNNSDILRTNAGKVKIKGSFINFLPGEGKRNFGLWLFENNQLIKKKTGGVFKSFEIANLEENSLPVKRLQFSGKALEVLEKRKELSASSNFFYPRDLPLNFHESYDHRLEIRFPITITDRSHEKARICDLVKKELSENLPNMRGFMLDCRFSRINKKLHLESSDGRGIELVDRSGGNAVFYSDYNLYSLLLYIQGTQEACRKIKETNFAQISRLSLISYDQFIESINRFVSQAKIESKNLKDGKAKVLDHIFDDRKDSEILELQYSFEYFEVI